MALGLSFLKHARLPKLQLKVVKSITIMIVLKVSRDVRIGMELTIQQGFEKKTVVVKALSLRYVVVPHAAQLLYEETTESIERRELHASQRKLHNLARPDHRPSKKIVVISIVFKHENAQSWSYHDE